MAFLQQTIERVKACPSDEEEVWLFMKGQWNVSVPGQRNVLIVVIVMLAAVLVGVFAYFHAADSRYAEKCREAGQVTTDVREFLAEIDELAGDPEGDDVKEYLDRLGKASSNLDQLAGDLRTMRVSGKNEGRNKALIEAVLVEQGILADVETVLETPTDKETPAVLSRVKDSVAELDERAQALDFGTADFAASMKLDGLDDRLAGYVKRKQALDAEKKAEEERKRVQPVASKTVGGAVQTGEVTSKGEGAIQTPVVQLADASVAARINADIENAVAVIRTKNVPNIDWEKLTYEVKCDSEYTISLVIREDYMPHGAAHDAIRYAALVYDKKTGARRTLDEFISITPEEVRAQAQTQLLSYRNGASATRMYLGAGGPTKLDKFFVNQQGHVWVLFDPYEMAAFAAGATCLQVK